MPFTIVVAAFFYFGNGVAISSSTLQAIKIGGNFRHFCFGALGAETGNQPFIRVAVGLAFIAAVFTVLFGVTRRQNIVGGVVAAFGLRDKVIAGQSLPQSLRMTAVGAAIIPIKKAILPIDYSKCGQQSTSARAANARIVIAAYSKILPMCLAPLLMIFPFFVTIGFSPRLIKFASQFNVSFSILLIVSLYFQWIFGARERSRGVFAVSTPGLPGVSVFSELKILRCCGKHVATLGTAFGRGVHSVPLSLFHRLLLASGVDDHCSGSYSLASKGNYIS